MTARAQTLAELLDALQAEGLLEGSATARAAALLDRLGDAQPWYVRTMVGLGAWLASLLLIGFVAGFGLALGASSVIGLLLVVAATWVRRQAAFGDNDFVAQCTLATSLAGQALFAWGLADVLGGDVVKSACLVLLVTSAGLFFAFPDRIHRVLMVLLAACALVTLAYALETPAAVPVIGPLLAAALVWVHRRRAEMTAAGLGELVRPLETGLMLAAFGCLLLSTVYVLPELGSDFTFYPRPWLSAVLLGALFVYVGHRARLALATPGDTLAGPVVYALLLAIVAAAWAAPGLLLALIVVLLGTATGNRAFVAAGIAFLVVFIAAYFYGIEITMLEKAITLVVTGSATLLTRWLLLRVLRRAPDG